MSLSNPPKDTPTNTSLREELKSIAYSSEVKPTGWQSIYVDESGRWDKYVFNLDDLVALLTAKTTEARIDELNQAFAGAAKINHGGLVLNKHYLEARLEQLQHPTKETE